MADDRAGRDKQGLDAERRQREREIRAELDRRDEREPPVPEAELAELEAALEGVAFPATGAEVVAAVGDRAITTDEDRYAVRSLIADSGVEAFEHPSVVGVRVRRPQVATAMKRIVTAAKSIPDADLPAEKRDAYEKTLRTMRTLDPDGDSAVRTLTDWVVDEIGETNELPSSPAVRRKGAEIAGEYGYEVETDDWLWV